MFLLVQESSASSVLSGKVYEKHAHMSFQIFVTQSKNSQILKIYQQDQRRRPKQ